MSERSSSRNGDPLGHPLPLDEHAVSVSLPYWADVVGYEEGDRRVVSAMQIGYPRFKIHSYIDQLVDFAKKNSESVDHSRFSECMIFPTMAVAERFKAFLESESTDVDAVICPLGFQDVTCVFFPDAVKIKVGDSLRMHAGHWFITTRGKCS